MQEPKIHILAETTHWLAISKPPGIVTEQHPGGKPSVETIVLNYLKANSRREKPFLGVVHRLDKVTSGVLLMAKKKSALKALNGAFRDRLVTKVYQVLITNMPPEETGTLTHHLVKNQRKMCAFIHDTPTTGSTEVILEYRVMRKESDCWLLEVRPLTGKFHQIRAQLAHIGCPVFGDEKYGGMKRIEPGIALHAFSLTFPDPTIEKQVTIHDDTAIDFWF